MDNVLLFKTAVCSEIYSQIDLKGEDQEKHLCSPTYLSLRSVLEQRSLPVQEWLSMHFDEEMYSYL